MTMSELNTEAKFGLGDTVTYLPEGRQGRIVGIVDIHKVNKRYTLKMQYGLRSTIESSLKLVQKKPVNSTPENDE